MTVILPAYSYTTIDATPILKAIIAFSSERAANQVGRLQMFLRDRS